MQFSPDDKCPPRLLPVALPPIPNDRFHEANSVRSLRCWVRITGNPEPPCSPGGTPNFIQLAPRGNETARHISPAPPPPLWGRLGIILGGYPRVCLAHFRIAPTFLVLAGLLRRLDCGRRGTGEGLIDVPQIHDPCVKTEFYFGNSNLIRPSMFDSCAMFVSRLKRIAISGRVYRGFATHERLLRVCVCVFSRFAQVRLSHRYRVIENPVANSLLNRYKIMFYQMVGMRSTRTLEKKKLIARTKISN